MRGILLLAAIVFFGSACAKDEINCRQEIGVDKSPPLEVVLFVKKELKDYKLIDKQDCESEIYWLAIPGDASVSKPRVIGSEKLVVMNKKTKRITMTAGQ